VSAGLDGRNRDQNGRIREKNSNTKVENLRKEYGPKFGREVRKDAKLGTLLQKTGADSLSDYLKNHK